MKDDKPQFKCDDRVVIRNINRKLNDKMGTVIGFAAAFGELSTYIVLLDEPVTGESGFIHKAVNLPDFALGGVN